MDTLPTMQSITELLPTSPNWASVLTSAKSFTTKYSKKIVAAGNKLVEHVKDMKFGIEVVDWFTIEGLLYAALITTIIACVLTISLNVYLKIRYSIPAKVNCWFCNTNTKVLYSLRETWTCPKCHQYNGFTADGNYNKRIPAQYIEALNRPIRGGPAKGYQPVKYGSNHNGLCSQCNLNQVLKVFQLSSFVPLNEKYFDAEIEAEQKRLEQLYDICAQCKGVVEEALKRTPDKQQVVTKRKTKVNKVIPSPSSDFKSQRQQGELSSPLRFQEYQKDIMDRGASESDSDNSFLSLNNLNIGSKNRNRSYDEFHLSINSAPPSPQACPSPIPSTSGYTSPVFNKMSQPNYYGSTMNLTKDNMSPLWKDYPMVQNGLSPSFSVMDAMSCPAGRPAYMAYNASVIPSPPSPSQFNYQSSNIGSVFGGRKPLVSPPKFVNGNSHFTPYIRYGAYYDVGAAPMVFNPQFFSNPISRSSSQSSGFVSQQGGVAVPPQQVQTPTPVGFY